MAVQTWPALAKLDPAIDARGQLEVGVVEHDHRPVAAELEQLRLAGRRARHLLPHRGAAGEADAVDAGMAGERVADDGTVAASRR